MAQANQKGPHTPLSSRRPGRQASRAPYSLRLATSTCGHPPPPTDTHGGQRGNPGYDHPGTVTENNLTYGLGFWLRLFTGLPKYSNSTVKGVWIGEQLVRKSWRFTRVRRGTAEPKSRRSVSGWPGHSSVLGALPKHAGTSYVPPSALPGQPLRAGGAQLPRNQALSPPKSATPQRHPPCQDRRLSQARSRPRVAQLPTAHPLLFPRAMDTWPLAYGEPPPGGQGWGVGDLSPQSS